MLWLLMDGAFGVMFAGLGLGVVLLGRCCFACGVWVAWCVLLAGLVCMIACFVI